MRKTWRLYLVTELNKWEWEIGLSRNRIKIIDVRELAHDKPDEEIIKNIIIIKAERCGYQQSEIRTKVTTSKNKCNLVREVNDTAFRL